MENRSLDNIIKSSLENFEVEVTPQEWAFMEDMLNAEEVTPIDEAAKSELQNMEVPFDATAWLAMEGALNNLELEGIDEVAKSALEDFETPYNPDDWSVMEQKIEMELPDVVDDLAKTALGDYSVPFVPLHWTMMDNQLDDLGFPHEADEAAKAALQQYESALPSDWSAMEVSLNEDEEVRRQLILTKSIELVLFIFAIWTIGNFLPFNHKSSNALVPPTEIIEQENASTTTPIANYNSESDLIETSEMSVISIENLGVQSNSSQGASSTIETSNVNLPKINSVDKTSEAIINNPVKEIIKQVKGTKSDNVNSVEESVLTTKPLATISAEDLVTYGKDKKGPSFTLDKPKSELKNALTVASFVEKKTPELVFNTPERSISSVSPKYVASPFHIKASVSTQHANFIEDDRIQTAMGLATNLGVDYAISDRLEVSTGFVYNNKNYAYNDFEPFMNTNDPKVVHFSRNVKLDILQIPLRLNFNFKKNKKTRLYAVTGVTPGLIIKEDTENTNALLLSGSIEGSFRGDSGDDAMFTAGTGDSNSDKISARTFATADLGLGLEYKASSRFSFFIEPLFQRSLGRIGNDDEKYKNYSLALGSRVAL